ncbi:unnamed protein product [marine sediment metagenome]|uniref:Uncharacterized protein n=1 Tax=marine sediment metagenome TaxID=412755 RepID=X0ZPG3_9ZZZZ
MAGHINTQFERQRKEAALDSIGWWNFIRLAQRAGAYDMVIQCGMNFE